MRRSLTALIALCLASSSGAQSDKAIVGWWRATLTHAGESRNIWLHFQEHDGALAATFSNPDIRIEDVQLGKVTVRPDAVELKSIGWTLHRDRDTLTGTIAADLIPVYNLEARFQRSAPPSLPALPRPQQQAPKPLWTQSLGSPVYAGLAFDEGHNRVIAAADSGTVTAISAKDGTIAWSVDAGAAIRATPLVIGDSVYVPTDKAMLKLDLSNGLRLWASSLGKPKSPRLEVTDPKSRWDHYSSSAIVAGDSVYVGSRDGCVFRFNAETGATLRRYCSTDLITATPVVDGNRVYFASFDKNVYAAERDTGRIVWKHDAQGEVPRDLTLAGRNILAGSRSYDLVALDKASGKPAWTRYYWFSWVDSVANPVDGTIYIGSSDSLRVYALDVASGKKLWVSRLPGWAWAKPAVGGKTVYESFAGSSGYNFGGRAGGFAAIDRATGKLRWMIDSKKPEKALAYGFAASPILANGRVFAADLDGKIYAFPDR